MSSELFDLAELPPDERRAILDELADERPETVRRYIERHPAHLMFYSGWDVLPFHKAALDDALTHKETFWLAPRGSGKSTALAVFFPAWLAIAQPENMDDGIARNLFPGAPKRIDPSNIRIALTSNSSEKAVALLWQVKAVLGDQRVRKLFGDLEGQRWRDISADTTLRTEKLREATFTALGLGSKVTGGHYDVVIPDDWVTEDNARTELQRRRLSDFWKFTVKGTCEPWCRIIGAGTRYHPSDWYSEIRDWVDKGLWEHIRRTPALYQMDGELHSYWPEVYPVSKLLEIREQIGAIAFSTQYQNEVDQMLGEFFEAAWVERFFRWDDLPAADRAKARTVVALDPAIKAGPRNDFSVFTVVSYIAPYFYVRKIVRGQWTQHELVERAKALNQQYRPEAFGVEVVQGQEWLVQELKRKTRIPIRSLRPQQFKGKDKVGRASQVRTFFENARVFLEEPTEENGIKRLIEEMMAFPSASNVAGMDDCVDSLVWALLLLTRSRSRLIKLNQRRGRRF